MDELHSKIAAGELYFARVESCIARSEWRLEDLDKIPNPCSIALQKIREARAKYKEEMGLQPQPQTQLEIEEYDKWHRNMKYALGRAVANEVIDWTQRYRNTIANLNRDNPGIEIDV